MWVVGKVDSLLPLETSRKRKQLLLVSADGCETQCRFGPSPRALETSLLDLDRFVAMGVLEVPLFILRVVLREEGTRDVGLSLSLRA